MSFFSSVFSGIKKHHLVFGFLFGIYFSLFIWQRWHDDPETGWENIIVSDGKGYYSYLTHLFIECDMEYKAEENLYAVPTENGKYINRFYYGTALLEMPFFFFGYASAWIGGYELDGYSEPFAFWMVISSIFYVLAGFYFIYIILRSRFELNENTALLVILLGALGSNIIFYATILAVFSHAYSFFAIAWFSYQFFKTIDLPSRKNLFLSGFLLSLIVVIRPVNGIVIFLIPFFFQGFQHFVHFLSRHLLSQSILFIILGGFIPVFIQCWLWYMQTGNWIEWSYKQEGFNFTHPEFFRVLFSFRRGLFIYCPLLIISLFGFIYLWKENKWKTIWLALFLLFFTYIISSWWHWTYGDTFGMRPFNDVAIVFILLLGIFLSKINSWLKKMIVTLCFITVYMNLIYAYQFTHKIIHYSNMDKQKFFMVFMKTSEKYKNYFGGVNDIPPYAPNGFETIHYFENQYKETEFLEIKGEEFPGGTEFIFPKEKHAIRHVWMEVSLKRKLFNETDMNELLFVVHTTDPITNAIKIYTTERVKEYPLEEAGKWEEIYLRIWLPNTFDGGDKIALYLWNKGKEKFFIDDFKINVKIPKW